MASREQQFDKINIETLIHSDRELAFKSLFRAYSKALFGHAYLLLNDEAIAEDITQEAFLKIWKNLHHYRLEKGKISTWMFQILRNTAIDYLRKNKKVHALKSESTPFDVSKISFQMPVFKDHGLLEEVNKLKEDQKFIIQKLIFEGYTQQDLSEEFGIPLGTVKSRFRLAINHLRKKFSNENLLLLLTILDLGL